MPHAPPTSPVAPGARLITACIKCEYLLEGLPAQGFCPECGHWYDKFAGAWRKGKTLIMQKNVTLPQCCIKCGREDAVVMCKRKLNWYPPLLALLVLGGVIGILILLVVVLIIGKRAVVHLGVCAAHRARRRLGLVLAWMLFLGSFVLFGFAIGMESGTLGLVGAGTLLASGIFAATLVPLYKIKKIDDSFVWLQGLHPEFLARFPEWPY